MLQEVEESLHRNTNTVNTPINYHHPRNCDNFRLDNFDLTFSSKSSHVSSPSVWHWLIRLIPFVFALPPERLFLEILRRRCECLRTDHVLWRMKLKCHTESPESFPPLGYIVVLILYNALPRTHGTKRNEALSHDLCSNLSIANQHPSNSLSAQLSSDLLPKRVHQRTAGGRKRTTMMWGGEPDNEWRKRIAKGCCCCLLHLHTCT